MLQLIVSKALVLGKLGLTSIHTCSTRLIHEPQCLLERMCNMLGSAFLPQPRKPVAHNYSQLSPSFLVPWVKVAHYCG